MRLWSHAYVYGGFWFRILGYGLRVQMRKHHVVLYSERYGHRRVRYIGPICWEILRP